MSGLKPSCGWSDVIGVKDTVDDGLFVVSVCGFHSEMQGKTSYLKLNGNNLDVK